VIARLGSLWVRLQALARRRRLDDELEEELRLHLERLEEANRRSGMSEADARRAARLAFGNPLALRERGREPYAFVFESVAQDLRLAARRLLRVPAFTAVAVATLALGIGVNLAIFAVVDGVLLRPLPYPEPERLFALWEAEMPRNPRSSVAPANVPDYAVPAVERLSVYEFQSRDLTGVGSPETLLCLASDASYYDVLGVFPAIGRGFLPEEVRPGSEKVVIVSHSLWQRRFGGDPGLLGSDIRLDGEAHRVVGILPRGFVHPAQIGNATPIELHLPVVYPPEVLERRTEHLSRVVGRLARGASVERAAEQLESVSLALAGRFPESNRNVRARIALLRDDVVRSVRTSVLLMQGAVAFVLLIACVNLANLMLVRALGRSREVAVRVALGAGRSRVVREVLAEASVLALVGGTIGVGLAQATLRLLVAFAPAGTPRLGDVAIDGRALLFGFGLAALTALLFGLLPALHASQVRPHESLKAVERSLLSGAARRWGGILTAAEVALALVLLLGGGLLLRSLARLEAVPLGFETERVLALKIILPASRYPDAPSRLRFFETLEERVRTLPGVERVAFANALPLRGGWGTGIFLEGAPQESGVRPLDVDSQAVSPDYFATLGMSLLRGRALAASDREGGPAVGVVNEEFARRALGGRDPIGRRLRRGREMPWIEIVGVVSDLRRDGKASELRPQLYIPAAQTQLYPVRLSDLAVRASGEPKALVRVVQEQVWALDAEQAVSRVMTLAETLDASLATRRFTAALLAGFAGVALLLSLVGIYGVAAYAVSRRTAEIGLRMALGARPGQVGRMVVRESFVKIGAGVAIGLMLAAWLSRFLATLLFEVMPTDPPTFVAVALGLAAVAAAATLLPALRASRVDPTVALRCE
jgi:putative ABC transport system permease protein